MQTSLLVSATRNTRISQERSPRAAPKSSPKGLERGVCAAVDFSHPSSMIMFWHICGFDSKGRDIITFSGSEVSAKRLALEFKVYLQSHRVGNGWI